MKPFAPVKFILLIFFFTTRSFGQLDYLVSAANGELVNDSTYEFDIYLLNTGTEPIELATFQTSIYFNDEIRNGGTLAGYYIQGSSTLSDSLLFPNEPNLTFTSEGGVRGQFRIAPKIPPGSGNGSIISNESPGTKFGRFRISNSLPFNKTTAVNWQWNFTTGLNKYPSYINIYTNDINTNVTQPVNFVIDLSDPLLSASSFLLSVLVEDGWNMVSIPGLHPVNQNVNTWWIDKNPAANVFKFDGSYQSVTEATPGEGYWMLHVGNRLYNTGDEWPAGGIQIVPNVPLNGNTGWNLIGGYHLTVATSGITTNPSGLQQGSVFGYTASGGYSTAADLVPGYAYWILLSGSGEIILPTTLAKGPARIAELVKEDWGRIVITDNAGKKYILYGVSGEVNLNNYLLPPAPPTGMFDVRYGSGRYAEDVTASEQMIEMNGIEYPITVRVENMTIRVQDETGKIVNAIVKSGEDVVISNPSVEKLKVSGNTIPDVYALEQNYPNPFNPSTMIEFSIPEDVDNVKLTIYDALGQRVAELVNGKLEAGRYSYQWDASRVATGLYIYQLSTEKFTSTKKMMLIR